MSGIRVGIEAVAGAILVLLANTILTDEMRPLIPPRAAPWEAAVLLGLLGGFAERFVPNLLWQSVDKIQPAVGTPVQAVRSWEAGALPKNGEA